MLSLFRSLALLVALLSAVAVAVHTVEVRGQDFVDTVTGKRLMIIGVDYQPGGQGGYKPTEGKDALSDGKVCLRDAALLQRLGVNTIRVYNVDPTLNHDECASIFNAVGIYMIIDVNSPLDGESINRADPGPSYHKGYLARIFGVVENFKGYPNTLAFFAANEVMNDVPSSKDNPPYIRAVQRDLKNYIAKHGGRTIPVGYSAADVRTILEDTWAYFQCDNGDGGKSRSDFFGLNSYSWCGGSATFETAGYNDLVKMFNSTTIPVFFSEYGCNKVMPRVFNEVGSLYGKQMTSLSGGLVYEYSQEDSDYGLVTINSNNTVSLRPDYDNLQQQYSKLDIGLVQSTNPSTTKLTPPKCAENLISGSGFTKNFKVPNSPEGAEDLINKGVGNEYKRGKLQQVKDTNVPSNMVAYGTNGRQMENLSIRLLANDESNTPGTPTGSGASPTQSKKGAASTLSIGTAWVMGVASLIAVLTMC